ncbi:MAG: hypothetical protein JWL99_4198 [Streptomyces oryziradicis]|nr:hypothetical protein [Actinacidiphila oryziradicis]
MRRTQWTMQGLTDAFFGPFGCFERGRAALDDAGRSDGGLGAVPRHAPRTDRHERRGSPLAARPGAEVRAARPVGR